MSRSASSTRGTKNPSSLRVRRHARAWARRSPPRRRPRSPRRGSPPFPAPACIPRPTVWITFARDRRPPPITRTWIPSMLDPLLEEARRRDQAPEAPPRRTRASSRGAARGASSRGRTAPPPEQLPEAVPVADVVHEHEDRLPSPRCRPGLPPRDSGDAGVALGVSHDELAVEVAERLLPHDALGSAALHPDRDRAGVAPLDEEARGEAPSRQPVPRQGVEDRLVRSPIGTARPRGSSGSGARPAGSAPAHDPAAAW